MAARVVADQSQQERLRQDLGLGGKMSERSRVRLLNHNGTFNVRRNDYGPWLRFGNEAPATGIASCGRRVLSTSYRN